MILAAAVVMLGASALAAGLLLRVERAMAAHARMLERGEARQAELRRTVEAQAAFGDVQGLTEAAVEGGARTVQFIHFGIAAIPFGVLEALPPTRGPARAVRVAHDLIAGAVYGSISLVNRGIGRLARRAVAAPASVEGASARPPRP